MNIQEFSDTFDTLLNSYNTQAQFGEGASKSEITLDEYEKSLFLTKAQEELVINLYNGKNIYGDSFEITEELRRYLDGLVKTKVYSSEEEINDSNITNKASSESSIFFELPDDLAFITMELIIYGDESLGCFNGHRANVYPVTQDEYSRVKDNPFRGPTKYKAIRLDYGNNIVEIISKFQISKYLIKYLSLPSPIILTDLPLGLSIEGKTKESECILNPALHKVILDRAVVIAVQSKQIGSVNTTTTTTSTTNKN